MKNPPSKFPKNWDEARVQRLLDHYESQSLPEARVQSIVQQGRAASSSNRLAWTFRAAAAAVVLLASVLFALNRRAPADLTQLVMAEIAQNHSKRLAPEVASDRYEEVQTKLSRLGFSAQPAAGFLLRDFQLLGGRYCSVQSELAAQLKLRENTSGESCTLYVVPLTPALRPVKQDTRVVNGVRVQVWAEQGRLFGLARDAISRSTEER